MFSEHRFRLQINFSEHIHNSATSLLFHSKNKNVVFGHRYSCNRQSFITFIYTNKIKWPVLFICHFYCCTNLFNTLGIHNGKPLHIMSLRVHNPLKSIAGAFRRMFKHWQAFLEICKLYLTLTMKHTNMKCKTMHV